MKCAVVTITPLGLKVAEKVATQLDADLYLPSFLEEKESPEVSHRTQRYETSSREAIAGLWGKYPGFVMIMPLGAVFRLIHAHVKDKKTDPAIVVMDEMGRYAVSALSGHEGGANELAERVALICNGDFVVTTGSEARRTLIAGIGCRKGTPAAFLREGLEKGLAEIGRTLEDLRLIASVEDKREEPGLHELSKEIGIPLKFISKSLINSTGDEFEESPAAERALGVRAVAEPCAILGGFRCQLLLKKKKMEKMTLAIAEERFL